MAKNQIARAMTRIASVCLVIAVILFAIHPHIGLIIPMATALISIICGSRYARRYERGDAELCLRCGAAPGRGSAPVKPSSRYASTGGPLRGCAVRKTPDAGP